MADLRRMGRVCVAVWLIGCGAASAQAVTDPGDLAFWQSIQNSTNPAEFAAYLQAYPNGRFAVLARLRIAAAGGSSTAPVQLPAPAPAPDPAPSDYRIGISPAAARVGQQLKIDCGDIPLGGQSDQLVIVPAGTPVLQPNRGRDETKILWYTYIYACANSIQAGPFAPGAYELRWMSTLFNNDQPPRYEMKAKAPFTIR